MKSIAEELGKSQNVTLTAERIEEGEKTEKGFKYYGGWKIKKKTPEELYEAKVKEERKAAKMNRILVDYNSLSKGVKEKKTPCPVCGNRGWFAYVEYVDVYDDYMTFFKSCKHCRDEGFII